MFGSTKRQREMIDQNFGIHPLKGRLYYNAESRLDEVERLHKSLRYCSEEGNQIDDITWDDLEMNEVFLRINHTESFIGEQVLYHKLHYIQSSLEEEYIEKFEERLSFLKKATNKRLDMEMKLHKIGKQESTYYLCEFLQSADVWKVGNASLFRFLQVLLLLFLTVSILTDNVMFIVGLISVAVVNLMIYLGTKQKYEVYIDSLAVLKQIYDFGKWVERNEEIKNLFVSEDVENALKSLMKLSNIILGINGRKQSTFSGDVLGIFSDYIWGVTLFDVAQFNYIIKIIMDKQREVFTLLEFAGEIDAQIAVLSYRKSIGEWCRPNFMNRGIIVEGLAHPLIEDSVKNNFSITDRAIITGANASGKSTFMKSLAINCILAQTIYTCNANKMSMGEMHVMTCMSLRDDVMLGESYYYREAKYLKRMLDRILEGKPILCVVDEILKGTNTKERVAASKAILDYIGKMECLALIATHDNELTETSLYQKYHFKSSMVGTDIVFDYLIHEGVSRESNAIALLTLLGYPNSIVKQSKENML